MSSDDDWENDVDDALEDKKVEEVKKQDEGDEYDSDEDRKKIALQKKAQIEQAQLSYAKKEKVGLMTAAERKTHQKEQNVKKEENKGPAKENEVPFEPVVKDVPLKTERDYKNFGKTIFEIIRDGKQVENLTAFFTELLSGIDKADMNAEQLNKIQDKIKIAHTEKSKKEKAIALNKKVKTAAVTAKAKSGYDRNNNADMINNLIEDEDEVKEEEEEVVDAGYKGREDEEAYDFM